MHYRKTDGGITPHLLIIFGVIVPLFGAIARTNKFCLTNFTTMISKNHSAWKYCAELKVHCFRTDKKLLKFPERCKNNVQEMRNILTLKNQNPVLFDEHGLIAL